MYKRLAEAKAIVMVKLTWKQATEIYIHNRN